MFSRSSSSSTASFRSLLLQVALLLSLFTITVGAQDWTPNPQEKALADLMKNASGQHRSSLTMSPILSKVARERAADMAKRGYFDHINPDGHGANYLVRKAGYVLPSLYPSDGNNMESIAGGYADAGDTWSDFMGSPGHKEHLLGEASFYASQTAYGVGFYQDSSAEYRYYWVVITAPPMLEAPGITISTPAARADLVEGAALIAGRTSGTPAAASVQVSVQNAGGTSSFQNVAGAANWNGTLNGLLPGENTVRVRSLAAAGVVLAQASVTVDYVVRRPITVQVVGEGSVGGFAGTTDRALNHSYSVTATPAAGWLFNGWSGAFAGKPATLTFNMTNGLVATANFVPNPFPAVRGAFNGLIGDSATAASLRGALNVQLTAAGHFTGRLVYDGESLPIKGRFAVNGASQFSVRRANGTVLTVQLALDLTGSNGVTGTINAGGIVSAISADHAVPATAAAALAGRYTVALPADPDSTTAETPQGDGYAVLSVSATGGARLSGSLADGRTFSHTGTITADRKLALYIPLYGRKGALAGQVAFADQTGSDFAGTLRWSKPERAHATYFRNAFDVTISCLGARYSPPVAGEPVVTVPLGEENAAIVLGQGNLNGELVQPATLASDNEITVESGAIAGFSASINTQNGRFRGTFQHPVTGARTPFRGVILQKQNIGTGYFLGADQSGYANFSPAL